MLDTTTGEVVTATLKYEGNIVREFNAHLPRPARVGIEATAPCSGLYYFEPSGKRLATNSAMLVAAGGSRLASTMMV